MNKQKLISVRVTALNIINLYEIQQQQLDYTLLPIYSFIKWKYSKKEKKVVFRNTAYLGIKITCGDLNQWLFF